MVLTSEQIAIAVVVIMGMQGIWLSYLTFRMWRQAQSRRSAEPTVVAGAAEANTIVEDLFVLHRSGLLMRHYTRRLRRIVDSDILTGMLAAVQEFVRDSLRTEPGHLNEIRFGEVRIQVAAGESAAVAMVLRGDRPADLVPRLHGLLARLEGLEPNFVKAWEDRQELSSEANRLLETFVADPLAFPAESPRRTPLVAR